MRHRDQKMAHLGLVRNHASHRDGKPPKVVAVGEGRSFAGAQDDKGRDPSLALRMTSVNGDEGDGVGGDGDGAVADVEGGLVGLYAFVAYVIVIVDAFTCKDLG